MTLERREELKDELKNSISMALKDPILQQGFEIICKENAELKKENAILKKALNLYVNWADECGVAEEREKYRPFSTNKELLDTWALKIKRQMTELCMPLIWVRDKEDNSVSMINAFIDIGDVSIAAGDIIELKELYEQYTFLDGSPCGIEIK